MAPDEAYTKLGGPSPAHEGRTLYVVPYVIPAGSEHPRLVSRLPTPSMVLNMAS